MALTPDGIGDMVGGLFGGSFSSIMKWTGYFLYACLVGLVCWFIYIYIIYKYKISIRSIEGNSVSKPRWDRARVVNKRGILKWKLLLRRKMFKPVDYEFIYKGGKVYLLRSGYDTFVPMRQEQRLAVDKDGGATLVTSIKPLDEDVTYWYQLQQKEIAEDYAADDLGKKQMIAMFVTMIVCLAACVLTIYIIYKNIQPLTDSINNLAQTPYLQRVAEGMGAAPN